jgi:hemerythrin-like metal-binding protein
MDIFSWTDELSSGNTMIDNDHRHLIDMVNKLDAAMCTGRGKAVLAQILDELITYTRSHFGREERLMQEIDYSDYTTHKAEHDKLITEVDALQNDFQSGKTDLSYQTYLFLTSWLSHHIQEEDKQLVAAAKAAREQQTEAQRT